MKQLEQNVNYLLEIVESQQDDIEEVRSELEELRSEVAELRQLVDYEYDIQAKFEDLGSSVKTGIEDARAKVTSIDLGAIRDKGMSMFKRGK